MAGLRTRYLELWEFSRLGIIAELDSKILVTIHIINYKLSILKTEASVVVQTPTLFTSL